MKTITVLLAISALAIPAAAQLRKANPPTELRRVPPPLLDPCKKLICPSPTPSACDPRAFALAWQAFIDSPAPIPAAPACDPSWPHPSLICASLQRSLDRAAEELAEQEYKRRLDEVNAHAARCR